MHLPVDDAEHQLHVLLSARSPAALQLIGHASAAQRAASGSRLIPHALLRLLQPEDRLALGERHAPGLVAGEQLRTVGWT
jgi:hypothetical protein